MFILVHMLGLQWGLAGAGLCVAWGWARPGARRAHAAGAFALAAYLLSLGMLGAAGPAMGPGYHATMLVLAFTLALLWVGYAWLARHPPRSPPFVVRSQAEEVVWVNGATARGRRPAAHVLGAMVATAVHAVAIVLAARHLSLWFAAKDPLRAIVPQLLWLSLAAALLSASVLQALAFYGLGLIGWRADPDEPAGEHDLRQAARVTTTAAWILPATLLRMIAIGLSLGVGAAFDPVSPRHFWDTVLTTSYQFLTLRLVLGLLLPLVMAILALLAAREGHARHAVQQFLPLSILIVISEVLAAGLTVGLWGIAL